MRSPKGWVKSTGHRGIPIITRHSITVDTQVIWIHLLKALAKIHQFDKVKDKIECVIFPAG